MKKFLCVLSTVCICVFSLFAFSACGKATPKAKEFSSDAGIKITLTDEFQAKENNTQTMYLESPDIMFSALKEEFSKLETAEKLADAANKTEADYAKLIIKNNNKAENSLKYDEVNDLTYFTYSDKVYGKEFYYFAVALKGSDAFWLCQFACLSTNWKSFTPLFVSYAKTIVLG